MAKPRRPKADPVDVALRRRHQYLIDKTAEQEAANAPKVDEETTAQRAEAQKAAQPKDEPKE